MPGIRIVGAWPLIIQTSIHWLQSTFGVYPRSKNQVSYIIGPFFHFFIEMETAVELVKAVMRSFYEDKLIVFMDYVLRERVLVLNPNNDQ